MKLPMSWLREWIEVGAEAAAVADALTRHSHSLSALGWRATSSTRATTTPGKLRPRASSPST